MLDAAHAAARFKLVRRRTRKRGSCVDTIRDTFEDEPGIELIGKAINACWNELYSAPEHRYVSSRPVARRWEELGRGKPCTHILALSRITDTQLRDSSPGVLKRLVKTVQAALAKGEAEEADEQ